MTLNTMLYSYVREEEENIMYLNDFKAEVEKAYKELESNVIEVKQPFETIEEQLAGEDGSQNLDDTSADSTYIRLQIFDEIPEQLYTIECKGYMLIRMENH